jgi:DNA repair exonuclease SbcCD ATPase subunit
MIRLRRVLPHLALWLCLGTARIRADGADDAFIRIYNLIQQADAHRETGQWSAARDAYTEARTGLEVLRRNHPTWNERVVAYRIRYVGERLEALKSTTSASEKPSEKPPGGEVPASGLAPNGEVVAQFEQLNLQIQRLAADKQSLEAKLREALSAQPAPVDPREFHAALERITALQSTNKALLTHLEQQQAERRNLVDKVVADEARAALDEANKGLLEQKVAAGRIERQRQEIEAKLKELQGGALQNLQKENITLKQQVGELKSDTERGKQVADLSARLSRLQLDLEETRKRNSTLASEKTALERQLAELQGRSSEESLARIRQLESSLALAKANAERSVASAELIAGTLAKEKQVRTDLELSNQALKTKVGELTRGAEQRAEAVKTLEAALAAEKVEREAVRAELAATERKLAAATASATNNPAVDASVRSTELATLRTEVWKLRATLKEGSSREAELRTTLTAEREFRERLTKEKGALEKRLAAALKAGPAVEAPLTSKETTQALARMGTRVRKLEEERDALQQRLQKLSQATQTRLSTGAIWRPVTAREQVEEFHRRRR